MLSPFDEMVPTWATSAEEPTFLERFLMSSITAVDREVDTALEVHRVHAGGNRLGAFLDNGRGEHGRGRGAVAGDVVGLGGDFANHLRAHVFELVVELDLLGDGDAVLGDAGRAEDLSMTTLRPFGPSVTFTALASVSTPRNMRSRASVENLTSFADM